MNDLIALSKLVGPDAYVIQVVVQHASIDRYTTRHPSFKLGLSQGEGI